jgi:hypothetical protein
LSYRREIPLCTEIKDATEAITYVVRSVHQL